MDDTSLFLLVCFVIFSFVHCGTLTPYPKGTDNSPVGFYLYTPDNYDSKPDGSVPVLIALHGAGETGNGGTNLNKVLGVGIGKLINNGDWPPDFPFMVFLPQTAQTWNWWSISPLMDWITPARYPKADLTRIYLTGLSDGGSGVLAYPSYSPEDAAKIAAVVPVCTGMWATPQAIETLGAANLPLWFFHNDGDPVLQLGFMESWYPINTTTNINPKAKFTIYNSNSHDAWTPTYNPVNNPNDIYSWMLQYDNLRSHVNPSSSSGGTTTSSTTSSSTTSSGTEITSTASSTTSTATSAPTAIDLTTEAPTNTSDDEADLASTGNVLQVTLIAFLVQFLLHLVSI